MKKRHAVYLGSLALIMMVTACSKDSRQATIYFGTDIMPILQQHCLECHVSGGDGEVATGLDLSNYQGVMRGTRFGPIIKAGDSTSSTLVILVEGRADKAINMPHGDREPLTAEQTQKIRQWIDQGALQN